MSAGSEKADASSVSNEMPADISLQTALFDAVCESLGAAFIVYDKTDQMIFASRQVLDFFPVSATVLKPERGCETGCDLRHRHPYAVERQAGIAEP